MIMNRKNKESNPTCLHHDTRMIIPSIVLQESLELVTKFHFLLIGIIVPVVIVMVTIGIGFHQGEKSLFFVWGQ